MRMSQRVRCESFPCSDVNKECFIVPSINVQPQKVRIAMVAEAAPEKPEDYFYAKGSPLFEETTVQAFRDAGVQVTSMRDIVKLGVYLTTAVKCGKTAYNIKADTIKECSLLLEKELELFPNLRAILLMGDVAIKGLNNVSRRSGEGRVIPSGSTYKIRRGRFTFRGLRVFPSYLQAGPSFYIEKSKRRMIAEDIARAMKLAG